MEASSNSFGTLSRAQLNPDDDPLDRVGHWHHAPTDFVEKLTGEYEHPLFIDNEARATTTEFDVNPFAARLKLLGLDVGLGDAGRDQQMGFAINPMKLLKANQQIRFK